MPWNARALKWWSASLSGPSPRQRATAYLLTRGIGWVIFWKGFDSAMKSIGSLSGLA